MSNSISTVDSLSSLAFPTNALVGTVGEFARLMADGTEVPEEFYFAAGLTMVGALCSDDLTVDVGCPVDPRLFTVLLGGSAYVKKSTAMRNAVDFFQTVPPTGFRGDLLFVTHGAASAEGLARVLHNSPTPSWFTTS